MKTQIATFAVAFISLFPNPIVAAPARVLNLRAVTMAGDYPGEELYAHTGSKDPGLKVNVKTFLNHEIDEVQLKSSSLVLTTKADPASVLDKAAVIAQLNIPANMKSCVVLFLPGASGQSGTAELIDDGKSSFPAGSALVINATKTDLRIKLETTDFDIVAGKRLLIKNPPAGSNNSSAVEAFTNTNGTLKQFSSTTWPHPGSKRVIQIATEGNQPGRLEMRGLKDIVAVK